jgi:hypothetical protein
MAFIGQTTKNGQGKSGGLPWPIFVSAWPILVPKIGHLGKLKKYPHPLLPIIQPPRFFLLMASILH